MDNSASPDHHVQLTGCVAAMYHLVTSTPLMVSQAPSDIVTAYQTLSRRLSPPSANGDKITAPPATKIDFLVTAWCQRDLDPFCSRLFEIYKVMLSPVVPDEASMTQCWSLASQLLMAPDVMEGLRIPDKWRTPAPIIAHLLFGSGVNLAPLERCYDESFLPEAGSSTHYCLHRGLFILLVITWVSCQMAIRASPTAATEFTKDSLFGTLSPPTLAASRLALIAPKFNIQPNVPRDFLNYMTAAVEVGIFGDTSVPTKRSPTRADKTPSAAAPKPTTPVLESQPPPPTQFVTAAAGSNGSENMFQSGLDVILAMMLPVDVSTLPNAAVPEQIAPVGPPVFNSLSNVPPVTGKKNTRGSSDSPSESSRRKRSRPGKATLEPPPPTPLQVDDGVSDVFADDLTNPDEMGSLNM